MYYSSGFFKILRFKILICPAFYCLFFYFPGNVFAQVAAPAQNLFSSDDMLNITLKGSLRDLLNDRTDIPKNFPVTLSYINNENAAVEIPVQMITRGHFRRLKENCTYPPLLIQFEKKEAQQSTIFSEQAKLKLVMPCKGDEYLIREWLVYKIYNLITTFSFKARLVKVRLEEAKNKKTTGPFYGLLLEEEKQMAKRNHMIAVEKKLLPEQTEAMPFLTTAVFQYLIGNTDWSVQYQQNIKLLARDSNAIPIAVPYDFDHSGLVNAPYALPAEELQMSAVRQRRYRGYCSKDLNVFVEVIAKFNELKNDIYHLYTQCSLLDAKYITATTKYLDEFYKTINNVKAWQKDFAYPCDKYGTGNVVIKGLKEE